MAKTIEELNKENAALKETIKKKGDDFKIMKAKAKDINDELESDNKLLNDEISGLKKKGPAKQEAPARELSVKEKGFCTVMDIEKRKAEAIANAPEKNDSKKRR